MRYDPEIGWLITKDEFLACGYEYHQYKDGRRYGQIKTLGKAHRGKIAEIIVKDLAPRLKEVVLQKMTQLQVDHASLMLDAESTGDDITQTAVQVTANTLEINAPFIQTELEEYITTNYSLYILTYLEQHIHAESVKGYAKICALGMWIYKMVGRINEAYPEGPARNRMLRSFRVNLLTALDLFKPDFFEIKIPRSEQRFDNWMTEIINGLNSGKLITELVEVKRQGNSNPSKLTKEQQLVIFKLYTNGNAMSNMEIYRKLHEIGQISGWWRNEEGKYEPPTYVTINNYINENKNNWELARSGRSTFINDIVPEISTSYPTMVNYAWTIDGTGHNENIAYHGKARQWAYAIKLFDYASLRLLNVKLTFGMNERAETLIETVKEAIRDCGYKPKLLQCDQGPGFKGLGEWCKENGIKLIPAKLGLARAKMVENLIGQIDDSISRFNEGWSGKNRTAQGKNSQPSSQYFQDGQRNARTFAIASRKVRTEEMELWNNHIIGTMEGKPCGKTPNELWNSMESKTPKLNNVELAKLVGRMHEVKLESDGLIVSYANVEYTYFPPIETEQQRKKANEVFAKIPRKGHREGSKLQIFILEYGKPAPVFKDNVYWGMWEQKKRVERFPSSEGDSTNLNNYRALQESFITNAETEIKTLNEEFNRLPIAEQVNKIAKQPLTGRLRVTPVLDKATVNASETMEKAGVWSADPVGDLANELAGNDNTTTWVDPDTGEIYKF